MNDRSLDTAECFWGRKGKPRQSGKHKYLAAIEKLLLWQIFQWQLWVSFPLVAVSCCEWMFQNFFACIPLPSSLPQLRRVQLQTLQPQKMLSSQQLVCLSWGTPAQHSAVREALTTGLSLSQISPSTLGPHTHWWAAMSGYSPSFERLQLCTSHNTIRKIIGSHGYL